MKTHSANAFSLMELMIVIGIIGILIAIAVPSYQKYTRRAHFTEMIQAAAPYKLGVEECFQLTHQLDHCQSGENGLPPDITNASNRRLVHSIIVSQGGVITITPIEKYGLTAQDTYILTPKNDNDVLTWTRSGGAVIAGYAAK